VARAPFTLNIPGSLKRILPSGTTNVSQFDCQIASESASGVSRRKPEGWIAPTSYSFNKREVRRAYGWASQKISPSNWKEYSGWIGITGGLFNSLNHHDMLINETAANTHMSSSQALVAARQKIKGQSVDLGVAYAERVATQRMLGDTAKRMSRAVRELQRGRYRNAARALGIINDPGKPRGSNWTNHWLQLQYGWKPLLSDVYGACDALSKRPRGDWRVTAKASRRDFDNYSYETPTGSSPVNDFWRGVAVRQRGVFVRLDALPSNDLTMSLVSLGVTNPLEVVWERVPYSFVVDWVLPVGNWLDSLDAMLGYTDCYSSISFYNETLWNEYAKSKTWSATSYMKQDWSGTKRMVKVTRSATSGVPLPTFPSFKDPRSLGHMANGLSLLAQSFGRR